MLIHGNPRAEQTEPRIRSARFGIGRDETEHRPTLLGRTEIETEHPLAPRDESEQYSISVRSVRSQAWWPLLLVNLNLKPDERFKKHNLLLCGIIPGPNNPKDIHSFLRPIIDELKELATGIEDVYDAFAKETFTLQAHLVLINTDLPAMAKTMGISGHGTYN